MARTKFPKEESEEESIAKKSLVRSPGYPMIGLEEAIEKVKILWDKDKTNPIPREVAAKHLGYGTGGYGGRVIAALKHFGLISMKEGDIILSDKAVELAHYSPSDEIYKNIVSKIALQPYIYREIFDEYNGSLPSDATLKVKLIKEYKFNADKVERFINNFRSTIAFAGLTEIQQTTEEGEEVIRSDDSMAREIARTRIGMETPLRAQQLLSKIEAMKPKSFDIPLLDGNKATIAFDKYPIEDEDINLLSQWFQIYAPALKKKKIQGETGGE